MRYMTPDEAVVAATQGRILSGWTFWYVADLGTLDEVADLVELST